MKKYLIAAAAVIGAYFLVKYIGSIPLQPSIGPCTAIVHTVTTNGDITTYSYENMDGTGKLLSKIITHPPAAVITAVTYDYNTPNHIIETTTTLPNPPVVVDYTVNSVGYPTSSNTGKTYTYDAAWHLKTLTDAGGTTTYNYTGGNNDKQVRVGGGSPMTLNLTYTSNCTTYNPVDVLLGKSSKHWPAEITGSFADGSAWPSITFSYVLDTFGKVLTQTRTQSGVSTVSTYTYY